MSQAPGAVADDGRYRALVDALAHDVWRAAPDGALLTDLPRWRETTGQAPEEVLGEGWLRAIHPDDVERVARAWDAAVRSRGSYEVEYRIRPPSGARGERTLQVRGEPVLDDAGTVVEYVGLTMDVTDRLREVRETRDLAERLEVAVQRVQRLQAVTAALSGAVSPLDVAQVLFSEACSATGASGGGVSLVDEVGARLRYAVLEGYPTDVKATWRDVSLRVRSPGTHVLRTREPLFLNGPAAMTALFPDTDIAYFVEASGERAWVRLPLLARDQVLGVVSLGWRQEREWDADERAFLLALAAVGAQALERAQAYQRQRDQSRELQRSLLPTALPALPGVELWAEQRVGTAGLSVGGDWCDAFLVPGGRVGLVVGDVRGKGAPAAAVMGRLRGALRAYALLDPAPSAVLERLDLLLLAEEDPEEIATLSYALLDPGSGEVELSSAGHLPALLVRAGRCELLDADGGLPLGVQASSRPSTRFALEGGTSLLLVTDGLLDERSQSLSGALDALVARASSAPTDPAALAAHLLDGSASAADDDVTVLVAAWAGASASRSAALELAEDLRSARQARSFAAETVLAWRPALRGAAAVDDLLLLVSELVTNAVVHARSAPTLVLADEGDALRVEVVDRAGEEPVRRREAAQEDTNGRGLALLEELAARWGSRTEADGRKAVWFLLPLG